MEFNNKLQPKPQGVRSNTRGVQEKLRQHIIDHFQDQEIDGANTVPEKLKVQAQATADPSDPSGMKSMVEGGFFEVEPERIKEFINSLGLRQSKPEYSNDETWNLYTSLLSREIKNLINNPKLADKLLKPIVPAAKPQGE